MNMLEYRDRLEKLAFEIDTLTAEIEAQEELDAQEKVAHTRVTTRSNKEDFGKVGDVYSGSGNPLLDFILN